jgi:hypothetical protein
MCHVILRGNCFDISSSLYLISLICSHINPNPSPKLAPLSNNKWGDDVLIFHNFFKLKKNPCYYILPFTFPCILQSRSLLLQYIRVAPINYFSLQSRCILSLTVVSGNYWRIAITAGQLWLNQELIIVITDIHLPINYSIKCRQSIYYFAILRFLR